MGRDSQFRLAWLFENSDCFAADTTNNLSRALSVTHAIPSFSSITTDNIPICIKLHLMLLRLWVRCVSNERDTLVNLQNLEELGSHK